MGESSDKLTESRGRIDALDERIVKLLNERAEVVIGIGKMKAAVGATTYVPDREREVLDRVVRLNDGPLPDRTVAALYRELMSGSFALERPPRIAYLGPPGSFSHLAATRKFGASVEYQPVNNVRALFDEIERDHVDLALAPVENSTAGGVTDTLDAFVRSEVSICAEIVLAVHQNLLGTGSLESIQVIYSKPEAFAQCQRWLTETGLNNRTIPTASTSKAAELAAGEPHAAAIGSRLAAELFHLAVLADRIEDDPNNVTRFLVLSKKPSGPTGDDKTSVYFNAHDRPGALVQVLDAFGKQGINMTFIQSRPRDVGWVATHLLGQVARDPPYAFFIDLAGHVETPEIASALEAARTHCSELKVLGSFPRAREIL